MKKIVLIGEANTKRTLFFEKAGNELGVSVQLVSWANWKDEWKQIGNEMKKHRLCVKIDPVVYTSGNLFDLDSCVRTYQDNLWELERLGEQVGEGKSSPLYLNTPDAICSVLEKESCKQTLESQGIPVTKSFGIVPQTVEDFLEFWKQIGVSSLFLKPVIGSGAVGVTAIRMQRKTGHMVLYTCAFPVKENGQIQLVNTKKMLRLEDRKTILQYLEALLPLSCQAEYWYSKEKIGEYSYDLRAVYQFGRLDFLLARLSKGPITNLQLNNHPLLFEELGLSASVKEKIEEVCQNAVSCFLGLRSVGIDILLERGSKTPRIIEMNGQGDLLYQDIYHENRIYKRQIQGLLEEIMR